MRRRTETLMTGGVRPSRVSEEFREILAEEIPRLKDPRIGFVTVVGVRVTPDLRRARVFYMTMGDERARRATAAALRSARGQTLIWIDHHVSNEGLGTIPLIDPRASSTCEIVWRLIREIGGDVPVETATCLYAGIVTDTGRFQYEAVTPETLRLAPELRED